MSEVHNDVEYLKPYGHKTKDMDNPTEYTTRTDGIGGKLPKFSHTYNSFSRKRIFNTAINLYKKETGQSALTTYNVFEKNDDIRKEYMKKAKQELERLSK